MKNTKLILVFAIVLMGMIFSHGVYAAQFVSGPNTYTISLNKSTYAPGESIVVNGSVVPASSIWVATLNAIINGATATVVNYRSVSCVGLACGPNPTVPNGSVAMTAPSTAGTYTAVFSGSGDYYRQNIYTTVAANFVNYSITYTVATPLAPTCTLTYNPAGPLTAPGNTTATWTSTNATSAKYSCTGPIAATNVAIATSGSLALNNMSANTENCTVTVTGPGGTGTCSRSIVINPAPVNGSCGTANGRTYAATDMSWGTYTQCTNGTASSTTFPATGGSATWTCSGTNGGAASANCSASRATATASCNLPWGGTIASGSYVTAYSTPSVACGSICSNFSQTRTCTNGTLDGTYTNQACSVAACAPTCNVSFSPVGPLDPPGSASLLWSSTGATSATYSCTGSISGSGPISTSGSTMPFNDLMANSTCSFTMTGPGGNTPCSRTLIVNSAPTYSCTETDPPNATLIVGDDAGLTADTPKTVVAANTAATKCEFTCNAGWHYNAGACENNCPAACTSWSDCTPSCGSGRTKTCTSAICSGVTLSCSDLACPTVQKNINWKEVNPN